MWYIYLDGLFTVAKLFAAHIRHELEFHPWRVTGSCGYCLSFDRAFVRPSSVASSVTRVRNKHRMQIGFAVHPSRWKSFFRGNFWFCSSSLLIPADYPDHKWIADIYVGARYRIGVSAVHVRFHPFDPFFLVRQTFFYLMNRINLVNWEVSSVLLVFF